MVKARVNKRRVINVTPRAKKLYQNGYNEKICMTSETCGFIVDKDLADELGLLVLATMPGVDTLIAELEMRSSTASEQITKTQTIHCLDT